MSEKTPYWQLLQDPRWQKKRLEILERDKWACVSCCATDKNLQVHHWYYVARNVERMPWEYPNCALATMCHECHKKQKQRGAELNEFESLVEHSIRACRGNLNEVAEALMDWRAGAPEEQVLKKLRALLFP